MELHNIRPNKKSAQRKRVGRGGKRGTYSGRGIKGQRAHSGGRLPSPQRLFISRFPKLRGVKFRSKNPSALAVNVGDLERLFPEENIIKKESFIAVGLIRGKSGSVKILGDGEVSKSYTIEDVPVSAAAREKIEKAGGKILPDKAEQGGQDS